MGLRLHRSGAPWVAILVCAVGWAACMKLGFDKLLLMDTILYGLSLMLEFAALIALRVSEPNLPRAYKVPGGLAGCIAITLAPTAIMCLAFYSGLSDDGAKKGMIVAGITVVAGVILYFVAIAINPRARAPYPAQRGFEVGMTGRKESEG
jgi:amino acid transporter